MTVIRKIAATRRPWKCLVVGLGSFILAASCGQQKDAAVSPVVGPCAGQPPGCGSLQGSAAALASDQWSRLPAGPLSTRSGQASVWTGHELLVWGGVSSHRPSAGGLSDGAAYRPSTRTWHRLPASPLAPRLGAAAVWMGTEAMFWGGEKNVGPDYHAYSDGAAYNPGTASWRTLPRSPLTARSGATAIWNGVEVIVFGGTSATGTALNDGATYDPRTNQWHSLPVLPLAHRPSAVGETVVWTGTQLFVWVTYEFRSPPTGPSFESSTGRQAFVWRPGSSSWSQLQSPPDSVFTYEANAIWTGERVLLLGGTSCLPDRGCAADVNGMGFAFDPALSVWREIPSRSVLVDSCQKPGRGVPPWYSTKERKSGRGLMPSSRPATVPSMTQRQACG